MPEYSAETTGSAFAELGISGLQHSNGIITEEFLKELRGTRAAQVYRQMSENDPVIGAILMSIETTLRAVDWSVAPANDSPEAADAVTFVEECLNDMSITWGDFISEALSKVVFGWSYFEVIYKRRTGPMGKPASKYNDGLIGWRKLAQRSQDTLHHWEIDEAGGIQGLWQRAIGYGASTPTYIPIGKSLLFRTSIRKNNPEGRSMLRSAYVPWFRKDRVETGEMIGVDRDMVGVPVFTLPARMFGEQASAGDRAAVAEYKRIVTQLRNGEQAGLVLPRYLDENGNEDGGFELVASPGGRLFDTTKIIERLAKHIAIATLQDVVLLGHENVGSLALADVKKDMARHALRAQLTEIADTFNAYEMPRLWRLNGMNPELMPTLVPGELGERDMEKIADLIGTTAQAGMPWFPDMEVENALRVWAGLEPKQETDDDLSEFVPSNEPPVEMMSYDGDPALAVD